MLVRSIFLLLLEANCTGQSFKNQTEYNPVSKSKKIFKNLSLNNRKYIMFFAGSILVLAISVYLIMQIVKIIEAAREAIKAIEKRERSEIERCIAEWNLIYKRYIHFTKNKHLYISKEKEFENILIYFCSQRIILIIRKINLEISLMEFRKRLEILFDSLLIYLENNNFTNNHIAKYVYLSFLDDCIAYHIELTEKSEDIQKKYGLD